MKSNFTYKDRQPTKRAADKWDAARFSSLFLASGLYCSQTLSTPAHLRLTRTVGLQKHQASSIYSDMAENYGGLKKELAKCYGQDIEAYVNGKTAFIEQVLLEIEKECENPEVA